MYDPTYHLSLLELKLLFYEKQKYIYAIFKQCLQTDKGKALVHYYESTSNAQAMSSGLVHHYTCSIKVSLDQYPLMVYIPLSELLMVGVARQLRLFSIGRTRSMNLRNLLWMPNNISLMNGSCLCYRTLSTPLPNFRQVKVVVV